MSHVLALLPCTLGKYELKYELTTLIYPFKRTSSLMEGSREIDKLLVPTDPEGADRGWDGTLSLHEWVWPSQYTPITHTHIRKHCFLSEASMDQFLLYEDSCLLKTGPEGHQMGVKERSMTSHWGGGLRHGQRGLYVLHTSWGGRGAFMADQCCLGGKGALRGGDFESVLCAQKLHV